MKLLIFISHYCFSLSFAGLFLGLCGALLMHDTCKKRRNMLGIGDGVFDLLRCTIYSVDHNLSSTKY